MKKILTLIGIYALSILNAYTQETLQTVTDRGNSTSNRITINPIYQFGSRITAYSAGSGYFDIYNNSNSSISLALKRSDGASVLEVDGHSMDTYFGGNVRIGTVYPTHKLTIDGDIKLNGQSKGLLIEYATLSESKGGASTILGNNVKAGEGNNTIRRTNSPNDPGTFMSLNYYHGITFHTGVTSALNTDVSSLDNEVMRINQTGNVGIGTTTPKEKLSVNGKIRAHEIKVETANWPDYVFAKDYQLPTLQQTEEHIKEKGHLPGIPSAAEVKANGIDLGEMNAKLLQKIEELTLHLIEMEKKHIVQQKLTDSQNKEFRAIITELKSKIK